MRAASLEAGIGGLEESHLTKAASALALGMSVAGDEASVKNALLLLDSFFQREIRSGEPTIINVHPHAGLAGITDVKEESCTSEYVVLSCMLCYSCTVNKNINASSAGARLPTLPVP